MTLPELQKRGYPDAMAWAHWLVRPPLGLLIPPSIIMIVYGVAANVSIAKLFLAGVFPGLMLAGLFMGYIAIWALFHRDQVPASDMSMTFMQKIMSRAT